VLSLNPDPCRNREVAVLAANPGRRRPRARLQRVVMKLTPDRRSLDPGAGAFHGSPAGRDAGLDRPSLPIIDAEIYSTASFRGFTTGVEQTPFVIEEGAPGETH